MIGFVQMRKFAQTTVMIGPMKMFHLEHATMNVCFIVLCSKQNISIGPIITIVMIGPTEQLFTRFNANSSKGQLKFSRQLL